MLAAKPCTGPLTFQEKPESSSVPFAKTKAWRRTSGTTSTPGTDAVAGSAGVLGLVSCEFAASVSVAVPKSATRGSATKRGTSDASPYIPLYAIGRKSPEVERRLAVEKDDVMLGPGLSGGGEDVPRTRDCRRGKRRRVALPLERRARKRLKPGLRLRVHRCGLELEVKVWAGRMPGRADEPDGCARRERGTGDDCRLAVGE